ncbi:MAG TPA: TadE/TadG family type IV pilus assembly protein [Methylomirabilota bacterium]|nr:TadE/TadG family type IV pilus assembly protein [Methylomirabilota bacterium]
MVIRLMRRLVLRLSPGELLRDRRGVSAVEFALILPLMLLLYAGSVEISEALAVDRKVNQLASTVGDLVSQRATINTVEVNNIFNAGTAIMEPYSTTSVKVMVAAVNIVSASSQKVAWAVAKNDTAPATGANSPIAIPEAIATVGSQVIVTRVRYTFVSPFADFMAGITGKSSYAFEHVFMMRPRLGETITWES